MRNQFMFRLRQEALNNNFPNGYSIGPDGSYRDSFVENHDTYNLIFDFNETPTVSDAPVIEPQGEDTRFSMLVSSQTKEISYQSKTQDWVQPSSRRIRLIPFSAMPGGFSSFRSDEYEPAYGTDPNTGESMAIGVWQIQRYPAYAETHTQTITSVIAVNEFDILASKNLPNIVAGDSDNEILLYKLGEEIAAKGIVADGSGGNDVITALSNDPMSYYDALGYGEYAYEASLPSETEFGTPAAEGVTQSDSAAFSGVDGSIGSFLFGNAGDDTLIGGAARDDLMGGLGDDRMNGRAGADVYYQVTAGGTDTLFDSGGLTTELPNIYEVGIPNGYFDLAINYDSWYESKLDNSYSDFTIVVSPEAAQAYKNKLSDFVREWGRDYIAGTRLDDYIDLYFGTHDGILSNVDLANLPSANDFEKIQVFYDAGLMPIDVVEFGAGVVFNDLSFSWETENFNSMHQVLVINTGASGVSRIVMPNSDDAIGTGIEEFRFSDGSTLSMRDMLALAIQSGVSQPDLDPQENGNILWGSSEADILHGMGGDDVVNGGPAADLLFGDAGDDSLKGGSADDILRGGDGDDTLIGGYGNDVLTGGDGDDVFVGGRGDDDFKGGAGSAHIYFGRGDGHDGFTSKSADGIVSVQLGEGILPDDLLLTREGGYTLKLKGDTVDTLYIASDITEDDISIDPKVRLLFSDGEIWEPDVVVQKSLPLAPTDATDVLYFYDESISVVNSGGGDDTIYGPSTGSVTIDAGAGNDSIHGQWGAQNTYVFGYGSGHDEIHPSGNYTETFRFTDGISIDDLSFVPGESGALIVQIQAADGTIDSTVTIDYFNSTVDSASFVFDEGPTLGKDDVLALLSDVPEQSDLSVGDDLPELSATQDVAFSYVLPENMMSGQGPIDYNVLWGGYDPSALPDWLHFDASTRTLSGTPNNWEVGDYGLGVTGYDQYGSTASMPLDLYVEDANDGPVLAQPLQDASVQVGAYLQYVLPDGVFDDIDTNDELVLTAALVNGDKLPSWLKFEPEGRGLYGTPGVTDAGNLQIRIAATDQTGVAVDDVLTLSVVNGTNNPPVIQQPLADQVASEDSAFSYQVPASAFIDSDAGDALTLSATLADGSALPAWLSFDASTQTFSGIPGNDEVGVLNLFVTATDGAGASVAHSFNIAIQNTNDAPTLNGSIADRSINEDDEFSFTIPAGMFSDADAGDTLTYNAILADGAALPAWLNFDATSQSFGGTPADGDVGNLAIQISATDGADISVATTFNLQVLNVGGTDFYGTTSADTLIGTVGNDLLDGGAGTDTLQGGDGNDVYIVDETGDYIIEHAGQGIDSITASVSYALDPNIENLSLVGAALNGYGNTMANTLVGNALNNMLAGDSGDDVLYGNDGQDALYGDAGADQVYGGMGNDELNGWTGDDWLDGGDGDDTLNGDADNDTLLGGSGDDQLYGYTGNDYLFGGEGSDALGGEGGNDISQGGAGDDILYDVSGKGLLDGGEGNDVLTAGTSNDLLIGGAGNDSITTKTGADIIAFNAGDGADTIAASKGADNTVSLGGGINYSELFLQRSGDDLILKTDGQSSNEGLSFVDWYRSSSNHSVANLQVIAEAMDGFEQSGASPLKDERVERFNFEGLASAFDAARVADSNLTSWALSGALASFNLGGSDSAAIGGDLTYQYGRYGDLANIGAVGAQDVLNASAFGASAQGFKDQSALQLGARLS